MTAELRNAEFGDRRFDVAFAVRVGAFLRSPEKELAVLARHLVSGGRLIVIHDPPDPAGAPAVQARLESVLAGHGWTVAERLCHGPGGLVAGVAALPPSAVAA